MKKLDLSLLENADRNTVERLAELCQPVSKKEQNKLWSRLQGRSGDEWQTERERGVDMYICSSKDFETDNDYEVRGVDIYMRPKWFKPVMTAVVCCLLVVGLFGGAFILKRNSDKNKEVQSDSQGIGYTAGELTDIGYKKSKIALPDEIPMLYSCMPFGDEGKQLLLGSAKGTTIGFWVADRDFSTFDEVKIPDFRYLGKYVPCTAADGTLVEFACDVDYGDLGDPYQDPDFDYQTYNKNADWKFIVRTFSLDGTMTSEADVTDYPVVAAEDVVVSETASDGQTIIAKVNGKFEVFSIDGKYLGSPQLPEGESIRTTGRDCDNNILCVVEVEGGIQLRKLNADGTLADSPVTYDSVGYISGQITPGEGEYSCYIRSISTIFGVKKDDSSLVPLFSTKSAGIKDDDVSGFSVGSDGLFNVVTHNFSNLTWSIKKYTPCSPEEMENLPVVKIGIYQKSSWGMEYIDDFNDQCSDFKVELVDYYVQPSSDTDSDAYRNAYEDAQTKIREDLLNGELPDMFIFQHNSSPVLGDVNIGKTGALCDLSEFLEKDDELNYDTIMPQSVKLAKANSDGHIYSLSNYFSINMPFTAKTSLVKDIDKWDVGAMLDLLEKKGTDRVLYGGWVTGNKEYQRSRLNYIPLTCWLDFDKAECYFDSPEFLRHLKYSLAGEPNEPDNYVPDMTEPTPEEQARQQTEANGGLINDIALFNDVGFGDYKSYVKYTAGQFDHAPITTLGTLTYDGSGKKYVLESTMDSYGINVDSEYKEYAWEFIKYLFSDEYYGSTKFAKNWSVGAFPATKKAMERLRSYDKEPEEYQYEEQLKDYTGIVYWSGEEYDRSTGRTTPTYVRAGYVTDDVIAEVDRLLELAEPSLSGAGKLGIDPDNYESYNEINSIFYEETDKLFAGEYTPEHCAEVLQSRLAIYMSENYG